MSAELKSKMTSRRHLTILFSDLVGYTSLSEALDPEVLGEIQYRYQSLVAEIVQRHGGYLASSWGDGTLAYFGFPSAHENDVERAVNAALDIVAQVPRLRGDAATLDVRVGIDTGLVVIGPELLGAGNVETNVVGMAANLASRIQAEAPANAVLVSGDTMTLVQGLFEVQPLGYRTIRGLSRPVELFRILAARSATGRSQARMARGALRMVGRQAALARLRDLWAQVGSEGCRVVQVLGEPGIGKTRLTQEFCNELDLPAPHTIVAACAEMFTATPLLPATGIFRARAGLRPEQSEEKQRSLVRAFLAERGRVDQADFEAACALLGIPCPVSEPSPPAQLRARQFNLIAGLLENVVRLGPTLLWVDDAHWLDPSSAELLSELVRRLADAHLLVIVTQRTYPSIAGIPPVDETVRLHQLEPADALELARSVPGAANMQREDLARIIGTAEGVPLIIEQLIFSVLRQQRDGDDRTDLRIPISLSEMMASRLDRVDGGRQFAQCASCVGRTFEVGIVASVLGVPDEAATELARRLVDAEILRPGEDGTDQYVFSHALLHDVAYDTMLRAERRDVHATIHRVLKAQDPSRPVLPEILAQHLTGAGEPEAAIGAWIEAGGHAVRRSAHVEALTHLARAASMLGQVEDAQRRQELELGVLVAQIAPLSATRGSASRELEACCRRGLELALNGTPSTLVFPLLYGQCTVLMSRANASEALRLANLFVTISERYDYFVGQVIAHRLVGMARFMLGDLVESREAVTRSLSIYEEAGRPADTQIYGQNALVHGGALLSLTLFHLGEVDRGIAMGLDALQNADDLRHPHSTAIAIAYVGWLLGLSAAHEVMNHQARRLIRIAELHNLSTFRAIGQALLGWSLCIEGELDQGTATLETAIAELDRAEFGISMPGYLAILAAAQRQRGRTAEARRLIGHACATVVPSNAWIEPEVLRIAALVGTPDRIESELERAAACARTLGSPVLEHRCLRDIETHGSEKARAAIRERRAALSIYGDLASRVERSLTQRGQTIPSDRSLEAAG